MKTKSSLGLIAAALLPLSAIGASATHQLDVSATVQGNCMFDNAGPTALTFDPIDPASTTDVTKSVNIGFKCTNGTSSSVTADAPGLTREMDDGSGNTMEYTLDFGGSDVQAGSGFSAAGAKTLAVTATITALEFQDAPAGTYDDTVVLTIAP